MDGGAGPWFLIHDVRHSWLLWGWAVLLVLALAAAPRLLSGFLRQWRAEGFRSLVSRPGWVVEWLGPVIVVTFLLFCGTAVIEELWLRAYAASGKYAVADAQVARRQFDCHRSRGGRTCVVFVGIANDWYRLPYAGPPECLPMEGERVRLWAMPSADVDLPGNQGAAHRVLRVELLRPCYLRFQ